MEMMRRRQDLGHILNFPIEQSMAEMQDSEGTLRLLFQKLER